MTRQMTVSRPIFSTPKHLAGLSWSDQKLDLPPLILYFHSEHWGYRDHERQTTNSGQTTLRVGFPSTSPKCYIITSTHFVILFQREQATKGVVGGNMGLCTPVYCD